MFYFPFKLSDRSESTLPLCLVLSNSAKCWDKLQNVTNPFFNIKKKNTNKKREKKKIEKEKNTHKKWEWV